MNRERSMFWIGGSSYSGKSSVADRISRAYGFAVYHTDDHAFGEYMFDINDAQYPDIAAYRNLLLGGMEEFYRHSERDLVARFLCYCREVFPLICKDVEELSKRQPVVAEGAHILPELTPDSSCGSVFLTSTKRMQARIWRMEMQSQIPGGHSAEIDAYNKAPNKQLVERRRTSFHNAIASHIRRIARRDARRHIIVDFSTDSDAVESAVVSHFGLSSLRASGAAT